MLCVVDLGSHKLAKQFTDTENGKKQRCIRTPLKGDRMMGSYAKEHGTPRQGLELVSYKLGHF
jgi:hypothetical protein